MAQTGFLGPLWASFSPWVLYSQILQLVRAQEPGSTLSSLALPQKGSSSSDLSIVSAQKAPGLDSRSALKSAYQEEAISGRQSPL